MNRQPISIVIPVYKNYEMFYRYLNINKKYFDGCEVVIMNDYPDEDITKPVKEIYPKAIVINNKKNCGFAGNVNKGVLKSKRDYVFLMNSDVVLRDNSFLTSIKLFKKDRKLFGVGFAQLEKDKRVVGSNIGYFKKGFINHSFQPIGNGKKIITNFWAEGGASMFRRDLFIKIGMLDELFNPFYWEDIDLSYRAWKSGYKIIFMPQVLVEHHHESTIGKYFQQKKILRTAFRNQLFFHWKNLTDKKLLMDHLFYLPRYILTPGFFDALLKLNTVLKLRKINKKLFIKNDEDILALFDNSN
ncbi:glycosyltransferase family 2 protein [Patescibacteria group bacterium]|nr:glycosyltransferase family 2 protein [Patescibacteria group bacterium]